MAGNIFDQFDEAPPSVPPQRMPAPQGSAIIPETSEGVKSYQPAPIDSNPGPSLDQVPDAQALAHACWALEIVTVPRRHAPRGRACSGSGIACFQANHNNGWCPVMRPYGAPRGASMNNVSCSPISL